MSILSNVLHPVTPVIGGIPGEDCKPAKSDDCGDSRQAKYDNDHKAGDDYGKNSDRDDSLKHSGKDDYSSHDKDDYSRHDKDDYSKQAKNDDRSDDGCKDDYSKHADKDDYSKHSNDDHSRHGNDDYSKHDNVWKDAKNDDCHSQKDYCQPQKDHCDSKPSDDCGKTDIYHSPGDMLAKLDFTHTDLGSLGPDHSGDVHGALASMSSDHALDYAIGQMGPADHLDVAHLDIPTDHSHDTVAHAHG